MLEAKLKRFLVKALKILGLGIASFVLLFLIISLLLQFSSVQTWLITKITSQISEKVETPFYIERVAIRFPKTVGLKGIYVEDTQGDTLLYAGSMFIDVGMMGLLRNKVNVNSLELSDVVANMTRQKPDTVYNYQFLIDAFAAPPQNDTIVKPEPVEEGQDKNPSESSWKIIIKNIEFNQISYRLADHFSGIDLMVSFDEFTTNLSDADVLAEKYHLGKTRLISPEINLVMSEPSFPSKTDTLSSEMPILDLAMAELTTDDIKFIYSSSDGTLMDIGAKFLFLSPDNIQLHQNLFEVDKIESDQLYANFQFPESPADITQTKTETDTFSSAEDNEPFVFDFSEIMDYTVRLNKLELRNSSFSMKQGNPAPSAHFDPGNISLTNIQVQLSDITVSPNEVMVDIEQLAMQFSNDFQLKDFQGNINIGNNSLLNIENLTTSQSKLAFRFESTDKLLYFASNEIDNIQLDLIIKEILVQKDLAWLVPAMNKYYFSWPETQGIRLKGNMSGLISDLSIDNLTAEAPGFVNALINGRFVNLTNPDSLWLDMPDLKIEAIPGPFFANLPDSLVPAGIQMPEWVTLKASAKGSRKDFNLTSELLSNYGNAQLTAELNSTEESLETFAVDFSTKDFDVGQLLYQQETLTQPLALEIAARGEGLEPESMTLEAQITIQDLLLNYYAYQPLQLDLQLVDSTASVESHYQDEFLSFDLNGSFSAFKAIPELLAQIDLKYAQFQELGFTEKDLLAKVNLKSHLIFNVDDFFSGDLIISDATFARQGDIYEIPELKIKSTAEEANYALAITSPFLTANYKGNISPATLPDELIIHFSDYFELPGFSPEAVPSDTVKHFDFHLTLLPHDLVTQVLMNQITDYDTLNLHASYNNQADAFDLTVEWPGLEYGSMNLKDFGANITSNRQRILYRVGMNSFSMSNIDLHQFTTQGEIKKQILTYDITFNDTHDNPLYKLAGNLQKKDSLYQMSLNPENLLLNGEKWQIPGDNTLIFGNNTLEIKNFELRNNNKHLILNTSEDKDYSHMLDVDIHDINLGKLTDFSGNNLPALGGVLNGKITAVNMFESPAFTANVTIDDFAFNKDTLGNIVVKAGNPELNLFNLFASVKGTVTDLTLEGNYQTGESAEIDIDVDLQKLALSYFEGLTQNSISELTGFVTGDITIAGQLDAPVINGQVKFMETSFIVPSINSKYHLAEEPVNFNNQSIQLDNFTIEDAAGLKANLQGNVNISDLEMLSFDLKVRSQNFQLMDVKSGQNDSYHGKILVSSDLRLHGTQALPVLEGRIKLNQGSDITYTLPQTIPQSIGDDGIIEFVNDSNTPFYRMAREAADSQSTLPSFEQFDMSVNIEIDPKTNVKIIIDKYAGDFLQVKGGGVLSFGMDPGGRISLSGSYEISDGEYLLTFYDVVRRNFKIKEGSRISWSGNPMEAEIDIAAVYTVRTSPANILVSSSGQSTAASMRQQIPFLVSLMMKETLASPQISFGLSIPPEFQNAFAGSLSARIAQINQNESELNKQVFSLLIIGNFLPENPLDAMAGGGDLSTTARSSASQILTQQLNRLSDQFIRGVDINFDVESFVDYSSPDETGRTKLQVEVSRDFFDERVRVTVGSNIELEDREGRENKPGDIAGDFSIEYLITPEGNLILKGFRTKIYDDIFEDQIFETGISLIFSRSYNRFRDLFRKDEEPVTTDEK
jgi:hypothetical protein